MMMKKIIVGITAITAMMASCKKTTTTETEFFTDQIGVSVSAVENREYSYTDKQAGYW